MRWKTKPLGELCIIEKGKIGIQKAIPGAFPLVVTAEERLSHNEYHFEGNAVIIPIVSSTGHGHKSLKRIHFQTGKFAVGNILCAVIPKDESVLNAQYLYRFLFLNKEKELVGRMRGMANVTLPLKEIANIEIPLPPIKEQLEFVEIYNKLEAQNVNLSSECTHQLALVKQLRQAFLREAMQGKLVAQDPQDEPAAQLLAKIKTEKERLIGEKKIKKEKELPPVGVEEVPFEVPEGWVWCRLGEITDIQRGSSPRPKGDPRYFSKKETEYNWITISDITKNCKSYILLSTTEFLTKEGSRYSRYVDINEFVIAVSGSTTGKCCLTGIQGYIYDGLAVAKIISNGLIPQYLLKYMMCLYDLINSSKSGASFPNINTDYLNKMLIPLPPLAEQHRIVAKLDELMRYCDALEASIQASRVQNEGLLQQVLREALEPVNGE